MPDSPIDVARHLAKDAGALIKAAIGGYGPVTRKSGVDLVTETDRASERLILEGLRSHFPAHDIVAEESAPT